MKSCLDVILNYYFLPHIHSNSMPTKYFTRNQEEIKYVEMSTFIYNLSVRFLCYLFLHNVQHLH